MKFTCLEAALIVLAMTSADGLEDTDCKPIKCRELDQNEDCNRNVTLYHYTSQEGKEGILSSSLIRASEREKNIPDDDAFFGVGTYFTELPPTSSKETLGCNNYGTCCANYTARMRFYFVCSFPRSDPWLCWSREAQLYPKCSRNVWVYASNVSTLQFRCRVGERGKNEAPVPVEAYSWLSLASLSLPLPPLPSSLLDLLRHVARALIYSCFSYFFILEVRSGPLRHLDLKAILHNIRNTTAILDGLQAVCAKLKQLKREVLIDIDRKNR